jgi:hypothetical protein
MKITKPGHLSESPDCSSADEGVRATQSSVRQYLKVAEHEFEECNRCKQKATRSTTKQTQKNAQYGSNLGRRYSVT